MVLNPIERKSQRSGNSMGRVWITCISFFSFYSASTWQRPLSIFLAPSHFQDKGVHGIAEIGTLLSIGPLLLCGTAGSRALSDKSQRKTEIFFHLAAGIACSRYASVSRHPIPSA